MFRVSMHRIALCALGSVSLLHCASAGSSQSTVDRMVSDVAAIHQGAGPFAVAGYKIGARALSELSLERGSWDLEVVHHAPAEVQWSCIADGAQAATGASMGRLNLTRIDAPRDGTETFVRDRRNGRVLSFRLSAAFLQRYQDIPMSQLREAGRVVAGLSDDEIFTMREVPAAETASVGGLPSVRH